MVVNDNLVGNRLKALRLAKGYTQEDVGKIISRPPQNIYKYEKGVITNIPLDIIQQLADLYGVSPAYICGWTDSKSDIERIGAFRQYMLRNGYATCVRVVTNMEITYFL